MEGTLSIESSSKNGKLVMKKGSVSADGEAAKVTLKSGTIESTDTSASGYGVAAYNGATVVVNGGEIISQYAALSGNNTMGNMNFEVNGGTLTAKYGPAIYMPGQVKLTITGGVLNGGISLRMGQVDISGGTINAMTDAASTRQSGRDIIIIQETHGFRMLCMYLQELITVKMQPMEIL